MTWADIWLTKPDAYPDDPCVLPELLELYRAEAGTQAALMLAKHYGGTSVYLPYTSFLHAEHHLVKNLGLAAAKSLCRNFGPGQVEVPLGQGGRTHVNIDILKLVDKWKQERRPFTNRDIARALKTSERYVRMVRNAPDRDPNQFKLFE